MNYYLHEQYLYTLILTTLFEKNITNFTFKLNVIKVIISFEYSIELNNKVKLIDSKYYRSNKSKGKNKSLII